MIGAVRYPVPAEVAGLSVDGHHVVEASAGTGKTFFIEHRVVDLLVRGDAAIEDILVVTFTDKAAAELRTRVRRLIGRVKEYTGAGAPEGQPGWQIDADTRRRLAAALAGFDRAAISTIHGFCHRLLADSALATRRPFDQSQVAIETAFADAFKESLREAFAVAPGLSRLLRAYLSRRDLRWLGQLLFKCIQRDGQIVPALDEAAFAAALTRVAGLSSTHPAVARMLRPMHGGSSKALAWRIDAVAGIARGFVDGGDVAQALAALELAEQAQTPLGLRDNVLAKLPAGAPPEVVEPLAALAATRVPLAAIVAAEFLPVVRERMAAAKLRRGLFDFQDMLAVTWEALSGPDGARLAQRLRARHRHALIDEFQDTDAVQWNIFRAIYLDRSAAGAAGGDAPGGWLTIVGDPKQAIYGFRGGDVETYLAAADAIALAGGNRIRLGTNYRSTPRLVDACNRLLATRDDRPFFSRGIRYDEPVAAGADLVAVDASGRDLTPVHLFAVPPREQQTADDVRRMLAARIAAEIRAILCEPAHAIRVGPRGAPRPVQARDIFVLTRSVAEADDIAAQLRAVGVPCALFKQEGLFQSDEAVDVRDLLAAIADPASHSARLRAWSTRFFALGLDELAGVEAIDDTHPLIARLYEWKGLADRRHYEELFTRIVDDCRLVERELLLEPSQRALTNISHLFELLLEATFESRREIHELVALLQHWMDDTTGWDAGDRNLQRLETDSDAVQVMTIHKAKGLEAAIVFLFGGLGAGPADEVRVIHKDGGRLLAIGGKEGGYAADAEAEARAEDERLIYVALTRAIGRLYLPCIGEGAIAVKGAYRPLAERLSARADDATSVEDVSAPRVRRRRQTGPDLAGWQPAPGGAAAARRQDDEALRRELDERRVAQRGFAITSYTRLKARHAAGVLPPIEAIDFKAEAHAAVELSDDDLPGGRESGVFLHDLLENVPLAAVRDAADFDAFCRLPEIDALFARAVRRHGREARHRPASQRLVYRALTSPIEVAGFRIPRIADAARAAHELEFLYPIAGVAGEPRTFIKGFIDLVFEYQDRVYVVDWKSDVLPDYGPAALARHVAAHYAIQGRLYSVALARMLGARDRGEPGSGCRTPSAGNSRAREDVRRQLPNCSDAGAGVSDSSLLERRFGGLVYWFLRGEAAHVERPDPVALLAQDDRELA